MTTERAKEFQARITREALALMVLHGENIDADRYEEAVTLIGKTWNLPAGVTMEALNLIQRERDVLRKIAVGEGAAHVLPEQELPINATGMETLDNVWDLLETAVQMDDRDQRRAMFRLSGELAECQNLLDWIKKTPAERDLTAIAAG